MKVSNSTKKRKKKKTKTYQRKYAQNIEGRFSSKEVVSHHSKEDDQDSEERLCWYDGKILFCDNCGKKGHLEIRCIYSFSKDKDCHTSSCCEERPKIVAIVNEGTLEEEDRS